MVRDQHVLSYLLSHFVIFVFLEPCHVMSTVQLTAFVSLSCLFYYEAELCLLSLVSLFAKAYINSSMIYKK